MDNTLKSIVLISGDEEGHDSLLSKLRKLASQVHTILKKSRWGGEGRVRKRLSKKGERG